jgi:hypothetical protein
MQYRLSWNSAGAALALGLCMQAPAVAVNNLDYVFSNAAQACQLSIPTIDTRVSPRATGFRNDGTATTWVICGLWKPVADSDYLDASIYLTAAADAARDVTCTGVNGEADGVQQYASKTVHVPAGGSNAAVFSPADFGGTTSIPSGFNFSITCALPPHATIERVRSHVSRDIGA